MSFTVWLCQHPLTWAPTWVQHWRQRYIARVGDQQMIPRVLAAQAAGVGITDAWAEPETPREEILAWFDEQLAATPRVPMDLFRMVLAHCPDEAQGQALSREAVLADWQGLRAQWWSAGRDQVAGAIADDHAGLYLTCSGVGHTWRHSPSR